MNPVTPQVIDGTPFVFVALLAMAIPLLGLSFSAASGLFWAKGQRTASVALGALALFFWAFPLAVTLYMYVARPLHHLLIR